MASSRTTPRRAEASLVAVAAAAAARLRAALPQARIAAAVSGGRDSVALLDALCAAGVRPVAVLTIDHGLSPASAGWTDCAATHAHRLGLPHRVRRVVLREVGARGIEEAARIARYAALEALCAECGADVLALAHHLDDQAETVLLQALRGSGPAGLAAMPALQPGEVRLWRPLLDVPRAAIERHVARQALAFVDDGSNLDARFARNALRHEVLPAVERHFPGYRRTLARVGELAARAEAVLREVALDDLAAVVDAAAAPPGRVLRRGRWLALSPPRRAQVLRLWLAQAGLRAPSQARLAELQRQLEGAAPDTALLLAHQGRRVRCWRDAIVLEAAEPAPAATALGAAALPVAWHGQERIAVPALRGVLHLQAASRAEDAGVPAAALAAGDLALRVRSGRERIHLAAGAPSRALKNVFQERGVPPWQRARLPIAYLGERLLWVAGIGFDAHAAVRQGERYVLRWEAID